ncbi:unnamed protein product [Adineta steineri]|uniref:LEM domain-containing protein n=1 Tax=Adineta steineri TaxID=433720 RepID=A0A814SH32_9BILA|nr:unnamed protein product [Adineta steineri]
MSLKLELQHKLKEIGYELGPFASKDTLSVVLCLHSLVMAEKNINVAKLNDLDIRKQLTQHGLLVGPVTNQTRAIYQRKLLEILTNRTTEGQEDEFDTDEPILPTDYNKQEKNSLYPNLSSIKTNSYSKKVEPSVIRHDYKATKDTSTRNIYRDANEIRSRISTKINDVEKNIDNNVKIAKENNNTFLYAGITLFVALIVFIGYSWFEK